ncbi:DUF1599 domain-containing protein [Phaeodactylibacter luteus]|uniref:DUF1599 domain-containing protein n=1 Tax=Phaeodactylibacter luteus TaxID=1564516 RepID=A0A5C6RM26_9BACT|nr:DUF1599 domain-containing protein [Phaeodactylibacter luteus]TXB63418.1 DUF1599 domain-containing protein [Phaeodactylibacter luteus]
MTTTLEYFDVITTECRELFAAKTRDYGTAWRILRPASLTDQLYIKAKRIRSIEEKGEQKVADDIVDDYTGLINYSLMALVQLHLPEGAPLELAPEAALALYDQELEAVRALLAAKNHDYGEAWRDMRLGSITDLILQKLLRVRQIEDHAGQTLVSEGIAANYQDIINYAIFARIKLIEKRSDL